MFDREREIRHSTALAHGSIDAVVENARMREKDVSRGDSFDRDVHLVRCVLGQRRESGHSRHVIEASPGDTRRELEAGTTALCERGSNFAPQVASLYARLILV